MQLVQKEAAARLWLSIIISAQAIFTCSCIRGDYYILSRLSNGLYVITNY